jgi:hypothetical protein
MSREDYFISCYQALIDKNVSKIMYLSDIDDEDKDQMDNYPNEYPESSYKDIFQGEDPAEFLMNILLADKELVLAFHQIGNQLATQENIAIFEQNYADIKNHPLINYSPNSYFGQLIETLSSITYSKIFNYENFKEHILSLLNKSPILGGILSSIAIPTKSDNPLSIILVGGNISEFNPNFTSKTAGYYNDFTNSVVVTNAKGELNLPFLSHELSHKLMSLLFNNFSDPYNKESIDQKNKYKQSIRDSLLNIKEFIKNEFGFDIKIKDSETTWEIGKKLCAILFPQHLSTEDSFKELLSFLQESNFNVNDRLPWLNNDAILTQSTYYFNLDLADFLIKNGANEIDYSILVDTTKYKDLVSWCLSQENMNVNFKNSDGFSALDYATDHEIIDMLISAGVEVYPGNYQEICTINPGYDKFKISKTQQNQLDAIKVFLMLYQHNDIYDESEEDCEFIVRFPEIIAKDLYHGKVVDIFAPIATYWEEVISPSIYEYQAKHYDGNILLPILGDENTYACLDSVASA